MPRFDASEPPYDCLVWHKLWRQYCLRETEVFVLAARFPQLRKPLDQVKLFVEPLVLQSEYETNTIKL